MEHIHNILTVEKSKMVSFASSVMKNIAAFPGQFRFPVKSLCCIVFVTPSSPCCLLKPTAMIS